MAELFALLDGQVAGRVTLQNNRLSFSYEREWQDAPHAYPLSLSMPLTARDHGDGPVRAFIWNLLPDNERTLDRWAKQFQVSARNPFALIGSVGEDCAGAVQFVRPDRLDAALRATRPAIDWLDDRDIGDRLRSVLEDAASGRTAGDNGQFSLAGAQPKTALLLDSGNWGIPAGRTPTTHILKPPALALPGHAENEHFCLDLARRLGLRAARSEVRTFDGQLAIVVERFDRVRIGKGPAKLARLHQEDMCQALAVPPWQKYQNEGGPGPQQIIGLIRDTVYQPGIAGEDRPVSELDLWAFVDSLIFNWMIGGTDGHAKNYGLLIGAEGTVRLTPLYDIASAYGLPDIQPQRMKLAMKIDNYYLVERLLVRHWVRWSDVAKLDPDRLLSRIARMSSAIPQAVTDTLQTMRNGGLEHPVLGRLEAALIRRAETIAAT